MHFWANHFAVSVDKLLWSASPARFEADAIRPHVLGPLRGHAAGGGTRHPAMLLYLDQAHSIGPDSPASVRERAARRRGLNENLAREILELHTLGVRSGYTQEDVTEFARALTGWTLPARCRAASAARPRFRFRRPRCTSPARARCSARSYAQAGEAQARAMLHDLAAAPATARHIAASSRATSSPTIRRPRWCSGWPTPSRAPAATCRACIARWSPRPRRGSRAAAKFKTPWDWAVSSLRALGRRELAPACRLANLMTQLGQPVWRPGSPAGYDDIAASWAAPDALMRRVEVAQRLAQQAGDAVDARSARAARAARLRLSEATASAIARAESAARRSRCCWCRPNS